MLAAASPPAPAPGPAALPAEIGEALRRKVDAGALDLPVLADAAQRVLRMALDENTEAGDLAETIKKDGAMAGHLLRVANSALYRGRVAIVSLQQAVSRLGMQRVREIALAIVCESRVFRVKGYEKELRDLFRHSLGAAYFAQEIARARRWNVEEAFLAGLVHDIGRPVLLQSVVDLAREFRCRVPRGAALEAGDGLHERTAAALVAKWELPGKLGEAVLAHHAPEPPSPLAAVVALADLLAHAALGTRVVDLEGVAKGPLAPALNLYPDDIAALAATGDRVRGAVEAAL